MLLHNDNTFTIIVKDDKLITHNAIFNGHVSIHELKVTAQSLYNILSCA